MFSINSNEGFFSSLADRIVFFFMNEALAPRALDITYEMVQKFRVDYPTLDLTSDFLKNSAFTWTYNVVAGNRNVPSRVAALYASLQSFVAQPQPPNVILNLVINFIGDNKTHWQPGAVNMRFICELAKKACTMGELETIIPFIAKSGVDLENFHIYLSAAYQRYLGNKLIDVHSSDERSSSRIPNNLG